MKTGHLELHSLSDRARSPSSQWYTDALGDTCSASPLPHPTAPAPSCHGGLNGSIQEECRVPGPLCGEPSDHAVNIKSTDPAAVFVCTAPHNTRLSADLVLDIPPTLQQNIPAFFFQTPELQQKCKPGRSQAPQDCHVQLHKLFT